MAGPLVGLTLLDELGNELSVTGAEIFLELPVHNFESELEEGYEFVPCQWWDETESQWSGVGCEEIIAADSDSDSDSGRSGGSVWCNCSHLTSFTSKLVPEVTEPQIDLFFTWDNLMEYPEGLRFLATYAGTFLCLGLAAYKRDRSLDSSGIRSTWEYIHKHAVTVFVEKRRQAVSDAEFRGSIKPNLEMLEEPGCCYSGRHWFVKRVSLSALIIWTR